MHQCKYLFYVTGVILIISQRILLAAVILIWAGVYYFNNGNPVQRYEFKHATEQYLNEVYNDHNWNVQAIDYSFKEGDFRASVNMDGKVDFSVFGNNLDALKDNYWVSKWKNEIAKSVEEKVQAIVGSQADVVVNILIEGSDVIQKRSNTLNYADIANQSSTQTTIFLKATFSPDKLYQQIFEIVQWAQDKQYHATLFFQTEDDSIHIEIPAKQLKSIQTVNDLHPFIQ